MSERDDLTNAYEDRLWQNEGRTIARQLISLAAALLLIGFFLGFFYDKFGTGTGNYIGLVFLAIILLIYLGLGLFFKHVETRFRLK